ncbi:MAG: helix-turn-helix domain-containing protein [Victivallales bacterium]|nr:helix-turn-helix domain-containing protein [Victivallales bacterium]
MGIAEKKEWHYTLDTWQMMGEPFPLRVIYVPRPKWKIQKHSERAFHDHTHSEIVLILEGSATHLLDGAEAEVTSGDVLVIHPGCFHAYDHTDGMKLVNVTYDSSRLFWPAPDCGSLALFRQFFPVTGKPQVSDVRPLLHLSSDALAEASSLIAKLHAEMQGRHVGYRLYAQTLLLQLCVLFSRAVPTEKVGTESSAIESCLAYMNTHYAETLNIARLAANAHMSPNSFFAHFRHATGTSPIQYLLKLRVMHASDHLLHTDWSMDEIARRNGFTDANYMSRVFRAVTGRSPSALRRL